MRVVEIRIDTGTCGTYTGNPDRRANVWEESATVRIKEQPVVEPSTGQPKKLGDEQHHEVMGQLQKIIVKQQATQMQDASPGLRDWR